MEDTDFFQLIDDLRKRKFHLKIMAQYSAYKGLERAKFTIIGAKESNEEFSLEDQNNVLKTALQGLKAEFKKKMAIMKEKV